MKQAKQIFPPVQPLEPSTTVLPTDAKARKAIPIATGCLDYFPNALAEIAKISKRGNDQHNPGQTLHWARRKSTDHADTIIRHFLERGSFDEDGTRHSAKMAWRALALLQEELEQAGAPKARGAWDSHEPVAKFMAGMQADLKTAGCMRSDEEVAKLKIGGTD